MKNKRKLWITIIALILTVALFAVLYNTKGNEKASLTYNEFLTKIENNEVSEVALSSSEFMLVTLINNSDEGSNSTDKSAKVRYEVPNPRTERLKEELLLKGVTVREEDGLSNSWMQSLVSIFIIAAVFFVSYRLSKKNQSAGGMMSLEVTESTGVSVTFEDVAGNAEAKESVADIVEFIKTPEIFNRYGARMPRGIIFYGPPGTGKTLLAKAIAKEAGVPFYAVSGSDFVQMYVGVGASRVRDLFKKARGAEGKAVIFIDEIDALGKKRSNNPGGGNDERDQTLNALLTEMSGFQSTEGIVVIAATNRLDMLDEALLRPGRFDRQIEITLPDLAGRESILTHHLKNKPLSNGVDIKKIAKQTVYFSGAMLENLLNEAAIYAAKDKSKSITTDDIDKAYYTIVAGSQKKNRHSMNKDKELTAWHEAGHALITKLTAPENTVSKVTIIPSTKGAGGFCVNIPPDKMYYTKMEIESHIMIALAGRASEEIFFGEDNITTGASNDLEKATGLIIDYVAKFGMSKSFGLLSLGQRGEFAEKEIIAESRKHMDRLYEKVRLMLLENMETLSRITEALIEKETIDEDMLNELVLSV